jgi:thiol-disulfide isomerase/thioredoxin
VGSIALVVALGGVAVAVLSGMTEPERGPIAVANPAAAAPVESLSGAVRYVHATGAPERLLLDSISPTAKATVLFFQGRAAQPTASGGALTTEAGGVVFIDDRMRVRRLMINAEGREITSVAPGPESGLWAVTGQGEVLRIDRGGDMIGNVPGAFDYSLVASDVDGNAWLVRSPDQMAFRPVFGSTPLLARLNDLGETAGMVGSGVIPPDFLLTHLASAGRIAIGDSLIYFAPFIRDEVIAMSMTGDTLWVAGRGLDHAVPEPRFEVVDMQPVIDYAPVNTGIALGPDGRLYVLSVPGSTDVSRIDVLDPETGHLLRSSMVPTPLPTLAADRDGRVYLLDDFELLTGVAPRARAPFGEFDLELLNGGRVTSADMMGKVVLINFWASWCEPCRDEMPALDALRRSITHDDFAFMTFNEDVTLSPARRFLEDYGSDFPVALGHGDLRAKYHYVGLPFTVLVDRAGKVVTRWIGYAGEEQLQSIRSITQAELDRLMPGMDHSAMGAGEHAH